MKNFNKVLIPVLMIFAICFAVPLFFFVDYIQTHITNQNIVKHGTECVATPLDYYSNITVNNTPYYSISFEFEVDGKTYEGQTSARYKKNEVNRIFNNNEIIIKYDTKTFNSIEANYTLTTGNTTPIIIFSVFAFVDLIFWVAVVVLIAKAITNLITLKSGKQIQVNFGSIEPGVTINGVDMYKISYFWTDENGNHHEDTSEADYTLKQAQAFEHAKTFKVKKWKNTTQIITNPYEIAAELILDETQTENSNDNTIFCPYCNNLILKTETRCSSCGAPIQNKAKKDKKSN